MVQCAQGSDLCLQFCRVVEVIQFGVCTIPEKDFMLSHGYFVFDSAQLISKHLDIIKL